MQFTTITFSLFAALAVAITSDQLAAKIPPCAQGCLADGYKAVGCGITDYTCQCDRAHDIFKVSTPCIYAKCTTLIELDRMAAATTMICAGIAQAANPNWTGPPTTDQLPPSLQSRTVKRSAAVGQVVASIGFVGAAAVFALAL
ncbi:hypothetical protein F4803DRAFT_513881 [Xylaria telfairii]|nr:hypothetical protein F4803DRAFT_513881 [Xylaria telfairii]